MIKYVIWDFNGTILDDKELSLNLLNEILKKQGKKPVDEEAYLKLFGFPIKKYYLKAGITFEEESFDDIAKWYIAKYQPLSLDLKLHDGVVETLIILRKMGIKNICLSASLQKNLEEQLKHYEIYNYFDYVIGMDNIKTEGKEKVGARFLKEHKVNPNECLYIGDTIYDYDVARKMRVRAILFSGGHQAKERLLKKTKIIIDNIYDIISLVNKEQRRKKVRKFFKDFGNFIAKGNVLDLAIGIIIGGAFNAIIRSVVNDLLMPVISLIFRADVSKKFAVLRGTAEYVANADTGALELVKSPDAVLLYWGNFLQSVIDFLIIGLTLFIIMRVFMKLKARKEAHIAAIKAKRESGEQLTEKEEAVHPEPVIPEEILLLREIRDSLKKEEGNK
ncbi:MAG: large conductance mechanosensitive channel protein MscL [Acholeplasmataceae bacterium]|jgi:phosphoglycolate phosphatase|nr:large conductance mechanosensitive channel protein MscL [Acholeplasmataceae bacterium]